MVKILKYLRCVFSAASRPMVPATRPVYKIVVICVNIKFIIQFGKWKNKIKYIHLWFYYNYNKQCDFKETKKFRPFTSKQYKIK